MREGLQEASESSRVKIWRRLAVFRTHDLVQYSVAGVVILFLVYQVVTPLVFLVWGSLKTVRPGAPGFFSLNLTVSNYVRAFSQGEFAAAVLNSLIYSAERRSVRCFWRSYWRGSLSARMPRDVR